MKNSKKFVRMLADRSTSHVVQVANIPSLSHEESVQYIKYVIENLTSFLSGLKDDDNDGGKK